MVKIDIIHLEDNWLVINKPGGLSVHNVEDNCNVLEVLKCQGHSGLAAVNRLDKETSGIMVLASCSNVSAGLQKSMSQATTVKTYNAILKGDLGEAGSTGSWERPLTNKAEGRRNPQGIKSDRIKCLTNFEGLSCNKYMSLIALTLGSGRQHQIRKHAVLNKHQVLGDKRYGDRKYNTMISKRYKSDDMTLHSKKLKFVYLEKTFVFETDLPSSWKVFNLGV